MSQVHLPSDIVKDIINKKRFAIIYPIYDDNSSYNANDSVVVREPWAETDSGTVIYRADQQNPTKIKWRPSIFLKTGDSRLSLFVHYSTKIRINDLTKDHAQSCGKEDVKSLISEWNIGLPKEKRPILAAKNNPLVWYIEFEPVMWHKNEE